MRRISDGIYWPCERVESAFAAAVGNDHPALGVVTPLASTGTATAEEEYVRALTNRVQAWKADNEGVVIAFEPSGHRIKIKSLDYVALHRARDDYSSESRILTAWSAGNGQKLVENLSAERAARLAEYYKRLEAAIDAAATAIAGEAAQHWLAHDGVRKDAAIGWTKATTERIPTRGAGFSVFKALERDRNPGAAAREHILKAIDKACRNTAAIEQKMKPLLGWRAPSWEPPDGNDYDAYQ